VWKTKDKRETGKELARHHPRGTVWCWISTQTLKAERKKIYFKQEKNNDQPDSVSSRTLNKKNCFKSSGSELQTYTTSSQGENWSLSHHCHSVSVFPPSPNFLQALCFVETDSIDLLLWMESQGKLERKRWHNTEATLPPRCFLLRRFVDSNVVQLKIFNKM